MKHNTLKRLASLATAGALALSLAVPAYATDEPDGITSMAGGVDYQVVVQAPTIDVEVSANGAVVLNPYSLSYEDPITLEAVTGNDIKTVATAVNVITNRTQAPVDVDVTVTGAIPEGSGATFAGTSAAATENAKDVFLEFALQGIADDPGEDYSDINADTAWPSSWSKTTTWNKAALGPTTKAEKFAVEDGEVVKGDGTDPYYIMAACQVDGEDVTPAFAAFKLLGDMAVKSAEPWTEADGIEVSVAFTFTIVNAATL